YEQTERYMEYMKAHPLFKDIVFKIDEADEHAFKKMFVRPRPELVNLSLDTYIDPREQTGEYLSPEEFYEQMQRDDTVVLRSEERRVGIECRTRWEQHTCRRRIRNR